MIVSAWRSLAASRWVSRVSRRFSAIKGASGLAFRPRRLGASPASIPLLRCSRHVLRSDEYNPSRRSNAPSWPDAVERSASWRMRSLYSTRNRRRTGFSETAGSDISLPLPAAVPPVAVTAGVVGGTPVGLRPPFVPPTTPSSAPNILAFSIVLPPYPLLYNILHGN